MKVLWVWNDMRVNKLQNFWVNYPFYNKAHIYPNMK